MSKVLRDVGEVDVASGLAGDASRPVHPCFGTRQNKVYLIERLVLCVIVHFGRHFVCMNGIATRKPLARGGANLVKGGNFE